MFKRRLKNNLKIKLYDFKGKKSTWIPNNEKPNYDTLRHILTHTPGFEDGGVGYLIIEDFDKAIPLRDAMEKYQPKD